MELSFTNKKDKEYVLQKAYNFKFESKIPFDKSLLIKGDNFDGMSVLLKNSDIKGKITLAYFDPPFNTNQTFTISNERVSTISRVKDGIIAYSDKMTDDEYFEFIRERLIILKELMAENGSIYFHIDYKIGHYIKILMDEVFGEKCFKNDITRIKSNPKNFSRKAYGNEKDMILFYTINPQKNVWNEVREPLSEDEIRKNFSKIDEKGRYYTTIPLHAPGESNGITGEAWRGMLPPKGRHWRTDPKNFDILDENGDIEWSKNGNPRIKKYALEHSGKKIQDIWTFKDPQNPIYPTEKNMDMIKMIIQQSSNPGDIVFDFFAGSGGTLLAAESLGRKWIGIDNSDFAITTIKNRLMGTEFKYYDLKDGSVQ